MKFGVIIFPGSNCDHDAYWTIQHVSKQPVTFLWHDSPDLQGCDAIIVPGGFAYGDYLRTGAIAKFSPVMESVRKFAADGGLLLGICNGFQILCEAGLLPGALVRNKSLQFRCEHIFLKTATTDSPFTNKIPDGKVLHVPIAHGEGSYFADADTLASLQANNQIFWQYCTAAGELTDDANPNGSLLNIAGVCNTARNVAGLMPHPERASENLLGSDDGLLIFQSMIAVLENKTAAKAA